MTLDELRKALESTADEEGRVTREGVVKAASDPSHPLHKDTGFLWSDDRAAAHQYRLEYAGRLIRRVPFISRPAQQRRARVPYFVRDPRTDEGEAGYVPVEAVEPSSPSAVIVIQDELRRVVGNLKRALAVAGKLDLDIDADLANMLATAKTLQARMVAPLPMASAARST